MTALKNRKSPKVFELGGHSSQREYEKDPRKVKQQCEAMKGLRHSTLSPKLNPEP